MTDLPVDRDENGRFVSQQAEVTKPDLEQDYHPMAARLFGWTRSPLVPPIGLALFAVLLVLSVALSTARAAMTGTVLDVTGFYAGMGLVGAIIIALLGTLLLSVLERDEDYFGEADTMPDDVEELL